MPIRKKTIGFTVLALAVLVALSLLVHRNRDRRTPMDLVLAVERERRPVETVTARRVDLQETIRATGALEAGRDVVLAAEVSGEVKRLFKQLGEPCAAGELLVRLDGESYRIAVAQAAATLELARVTRDHARRDLKRYEQLEGEAVVTAQQLDGARNAVAIAAASIKQGEAVLKAARRNLRETEIRCPFGGFVAARSVELGQHVDPRTAIARLVDTSVLKLTLAVTAGEIASLGAGQQVILGDRSTSAGPVIGTVARLGVAADEATRTFPVEVELKGGEHNLRAGQVVHAALVVAEHRGVIAVPSHGVFYNSGHPKIRVVDGAVVRHAAVEIGAVIDGQTIVASGLEEGAQVITVGGDGLEAGAKVEVVARDGGASKAN